jgi:hypothetical protein
MYSIVDVSETHASSILIVKESKVDECSCYTGIDPTESQEKGGGGWCPVQADREQDKLM